METKVFFLRQSSRHLMPTEFCKLSTIFHTTYFLNSFIELVVSSTKVFQLNGKSLTKTDFSSVEVVQKPSELAGQLTFCFNTSSHGWTWTWTKPHLPAIKFSWWYSAPRLRWPKMEASITQPLKAE